MVESCRDGIPFRWHVDRHDGCLSPERLATIEAHLDAGCATCIEQASQVEAVVASIRAGPLPEAPRAVVRRAVGLLRRPWTREVGERVLRALARLVFDEGAEIVPALRSAPGRTRRLLWTTDDHEVFVALSPRDGKWDLEGQVLPVVDDEREIHGRMELSQGGRTMDRVDLDTDGRFSYRDLKSGTYVLAGNAGESAFEMPPFVLT